MIRFLNKKTLIIFIIFLSIIIAFSCSLADLKKITDDPDFKTIWDVDLRVPVVDYATTPIDLGTYVEDKALNSLDVPALGIGNAWPIVLDIPDAGPLNIPVDPDIDFDGGGADFTFTGYYSQHTDILRIQIWLTDGAAGPVLPISSDCINIQNISIEGNAIAFRPPVSLDNKLIYISTNFLDPLLEYYIGLGGDNDLDLTNIDIELQNGSSPNYNGGNYFLHIKFVFDLGDNFGVVGQIGNIAALKNITGQDIPIGDFPADELDKFKLEFEYESNLAFNLDILTTFYGSKQAPNPPNCPLTIASGTLANSPMYGYQYVAGLRKSTDEFSFNDNVLNYGDMKIDLLLSFPAGPWAPIRIDTNAIIKVKIIASAEATISL